MWDSTFKSDNKKYLKKVKDDVELEILTALSFLELSEWDKKTLTESLENLNRFNLQNLYAIRRKIYNLICSN